MEECKVGRSRPFQPARTQQPRAAHDAPEMPDLARLGPEGVALLRLVPLVHIAWLVHEPLSADDRRALLDVARGRGISRGGAADRLLAEWLQERPSEALFAGCMVELKSLLARLPDDEQAASKTDLVAYMLTLDRLAIDAHARRAIVGVAHRPRGERRVEPSASYGDRWRERLG